MKEALEMSQRAIAYARGRTLADPDAARVLLLLAGRTDAVPFEDPSSPMGLLLSDRDMPALAATLNLGAGRFRDLLRQLRDLVPMDVLEHQDGTWEIVYGPGYTSPPQPRPARDGEAIAERNIFDMPGWEEYSTWGLDAPHGRAEDAYLYAQLYRNTDDRDDRPRIWITPPRYVLTSLDELAEAIAAEIAPYEPLPLPAELIRTWLVH
jgi:hypothetical protein